jgi:hypothetical protein
MSLTKLPLAGNHKTFPGQGELVTSRAGDGKTIAFFTVYVS